MEIRILVINITAFKLIPRGSNHHPKETYTTALRTVSADFVEETRVI